MAPPGTELRRDGLELNDNRSFQERFWKGQRFGWLLLALLMLAALAGLTGKGGPLARAQQAFPGGSVDYPRVGRWSTTDEIRVTISQTARPHIVVETGNGFDEMFTVESIVPAPLASTAAPGGQRHMLLLAKDAGPREVILRVTPRRLSFGTRTTISINHGPPLRLQSIILP